MQRDIVVNLYGACNVLFYLHLAAMASICVYVYSNALCLSIKLDLSFMFESLEEMCTCFLFPTHKTFDYSCKRRKGDILFCRYKQSSTRTQLFCNLSCMNWYIGITCLYVLPLWVYEFSICVPTPRLTWTVYFYRRSKHLVVRLRDHPNKRSKNMNAYHTFDDIW